MPRLYLPGITKPVSPLALGTMLYGSSITTADAFTLLDDFVAGGGTMLDTANGYAGWLTGGAGRSEITLGEWIKKTGARDEVIVATKGGQPRHPDRTVRATTENLTADLAQSLDRLQLPSVDLYWFHRDNLALPVAELMDWAWAQMDAGYFHAIGASNWTTPRLSVAAQLARERGRPRLVGSQIGWSLMESRGDGIADPSLVHMNASQLAGYVASPLPVFAYQAQARGFFSPAKRQNENLLKRYDTPLNQARLRKVDEISERTRWTPNQIALAWFWRQPFPAIPVIGARTREQLADSLAAMTIGIAPDDWEQLTRPHTYG